MSVLPPFELGRPQTIEAALDMLSFDNMPLAGGTELLLAMRMRVLRPASLIDLKRIPELQEIRVEDDILVIGGTVTHTAASTSHLVREQLPILCNVLDQVGNPRVRASGTLAGNLVFAEPKSDVIPILLALDARVVLESPNGTRTLGLDDFLLGPYYSAREPEELLTQIRIPLGQVVRAAYLKYQTMERPTIGVAALDLARGPRRIVVGAVAEQASLFDLPAGDPIDGHALAADIDPVPDIAGSARYKRHVTGVIINRAVAMLDGGAAA